MISFRPDFNKTNIGRLKPKILIILMIGCGLSKTIFIAILSMPSFNLNLAGIFTK